MSINKERAQEIEYYVLKNGVSKASEHYGVSQESIARYCRIAEKSRKSSSKRILIFDIETAPMEAYVWSMWKNDVSQDQLIQDWSILCWAAKWLGEREVITGASWRDSGGVRDDRACCLALAALLDEADIVVAHNGDKFDIKKVNTRLLKHGIQEPSPFKSIDTLKIAKSRFAISSNRLDFIGEFLGVGRKVQHSGFNMWKKVLHGDSEAQDEMLKYNVGDITLLEQVYLIIRGWDKKHPSVVLDYGEARCPSCAGSNLEVVGDAYTNVSRFEAVRCLKCGKYSRYGTNMKSKKDMNNTLRNIV